MDWMPSRGQDFKCLNTSQDPDFSKSSFNQNSQLFLNSQLFFMICWKNPAFSFSLSSPMVVSGRTATAHTSPLIRSTLRFAMAMACTHRCDEKNPTIWVLANALLEILKVETCVRKLKSSSSVHWKNTLLLTSSCFGLTWLGWSWCLLMAKLKTDFFRNDSFETSVGIW